VAGRTLGCMDLISVAIAVAVFAAMLVAVELLERV
jgi:hypothetical protein